MNKKQVSRMLGAYSRSRTCVFSIVAVFLTIPLLTTFIPAQVGTSAPRRVLILYSFDNEEGIYAGFDHVLRAQLRLRVPQRVEFYTEYLDLVRFPTPAHERDMARLLKLKYAAEKPDLVVPVSYSAVQFLTGEGKDLFPGTPIVALFNERRAEDLKRQIAASQGRLNMTGVAATDEPAQTLELALLLQPDTERVAVIVGNSALEHYWVDQLKQDFASYSGKVQFSYLGDEPLDDLLKQVAELPLHSVILSTFYFQDSTGEHFLTEEVLDEVTRVANAPVYAIYSNDIGHGVVGGRMTNPEVPGRKVADLAVAVLNGETAGRIPFVVDDSARDMVDWRQVERWGISQKRIPASTIKLFREPSLWQRYRDLIVGVISLFVIETLLVLALILNVRRRRRAEAALLREKTLANAVIEGLPGLFILQDKSGKNVRWNKNAQAISRLDLGETRVPDNIVEQDKQAVIEARRQVFENGSGRVEAHLLGEGGKTFPMYFSGVKVELEGQPYLAAVGIDLTERKKAEEALRQSEGQLRALVENAPYGIGTINIREDRFLHANPALVKLLGYKSEAEVLELVVSRDLHIDGASGNFRVHPARADFFSAVEFTWRRKDGKPVNIRASARRIPQKSGQDERIEIIAEDVTTRRQLEEQLRHSQKMEALGQLAGSVSHDFNNLLSVIIGYSDLLAANPDVDAATKEHLQTIKRAGERAASLTAQLLAFSRRQVLQPTVVSLNALIRETQKMLERLIAEDVEKCFVLDAALWKTKVDAGQMVQVLMNLAINARHAMRKGGVLTLKTENVSFEDMVAFYGVDVMPGNYVLLSVTDTGTGMDEPTRTRIFEPFFTTKEKGKGTGLGLATVYGIVKQSGGYIFADSEPGRGTTMRVYLPRTEAVKSVLPATAALDRRNGSATLLVVEDEPAFRDLLRDGLQGRGFRVLIAANGKEALEVAERFADPIRVLITDVIMPHMNGPELAKSLRSVRREMEVLYMSGYADDNLSDVSSSGELALIQKPFPIGDLVRKIEEILARKDGHMTRLSSPDVE